MDIRYFISEDDYVAAGKLFTATRPKTLYKRVIKPALWVLIFLSAAFIYLAHRNVEVIIVALALPIFVALCRLWQLRKNYRMSTTLHGPIDLQADETGLRFITQHSDGRVDWSTYERFAENEKTFLLVQQGGLLYNPIPKHDLSLNQIEEMRQSFQTMLPNSYPRGNQTRFRSMTCVNV